ncbi:MAG: glycosyltransferase family 9 protein [Anaerohalosphaeraceae bacterium]
MTSQKILIWLPSPLGDAIMATPALREFRRLFPNASITFLGHAFTRQVLSPSPFCDDWMDLEKKSDRNLIKLFQQGNNGAFDVLQRRHEGNVKRNILNIMKDELQKNCIHHLNSLTMMTNTMLKLNTSKTK